jgi:hypothetical protein
VVCFDSFDRTDIRALKVSSFLFWYDPKAFSISRRQPPPLPSYMAFGHIRGHRPLLGFVGQGR